MGPIAAVKTCFSKYVTFSGRASRSEFWFFTLFYVICVVVLVILLPPVGSIPAIQLSDTWSVEVQYDFIRWLWMLCMLPPLASAAVRRLHDQARSGAWCLVYFIPFVGAIWLLIWLCLRGTAGANRFGPDPLVPSPAR